ncbi:MAG TPA: hypothetical protein DCS67_07205 [Clostridiales bacterium UBA8960]|jgi:uncharacterized membrane protein YjjP (DUF1212 family)|nr:hypothetical protein [Clostridiales bacterium UBA8960]
MDKKKKLTSEEKKQIKIERQKANEQLVYNSWQQSREIGKMKFALRFGAYTWGLPTFLVYSVIMMMLNFIIKTSVKYDLFQAIFSLFFFVLFGTFYGLFIWNRNEKIFVKKYPYGRKSH